jgi:hypothetical protein
MGSTDITQLLQKEYLYGNLQNCVKVFVENKTYNRYNLPCYQYVDPTQYEIFFEKESNDNKIHISTTRDF